MLNKFRLIFIPFCIRHAFENPTDLLVMFMRKLSLGVANGASVYLSYWFELPAEEYDITRFSLPYYNTLDKYLNKVVGNLPKFCEET